MTHRSTPDDLALHGVRVLGHGDAARVAARYGLDSHAVEESLLDFEARGWVSHTTFADLATWSLTDAGRAEDERRMSAELDDAGARDTVTAVHTTFVPLNDRFGRACTDWQLRPTRADPMAFNDHTDWRHDERVLKTLTFIETPFTRLCADLTERLARFSGYAERYSTALGKANAGGRAWVDGHERDSCHMVWMQFHEDLLATLGIPRGTEG